MMRLRLVFGDRNFAGSAYGYFFFLSSLIFVPSSSPMIEALMKHQSIAVPLKMCENLAS